ncbi:MAG: helix-turn-helix transcriptional regulator [Thermoleophilia bacterium]
MRTRPALVGREAEQRWLGEALEGTRAGAGRVVLLAGEAGVGKTRLADDLAAEPGLIVLRGRADAAGGSPYAPLAEALRAHLRADPGAADAAGGLRDHLAMVLPELGAPPAEPHPPALAEAIRAVLAAAAADGPVLLVLDDLHWCDDATLELVAGIAEPLADIPVLVVGAYRSDGLPRDHAMRRLRHELRRRGRLAELAVGPLGPDETAALAAAVLGEPASPALARTLHDRAQGVPFFTEELARALSASGALVAGSQGLEVGGVGDVPVPETVRDAVLLAAVELSQEGRAAADAAAVAGTVFDLVLVADVAGADGVAELVDRGWAREDGDGRGAFRHALTREALYADVPWLRRRALHREMAAALEAAGAPSMEIATHWAGAREPARARPALLRAAAELRAVHAHRDAARAWRQALDMWPEGEDVEGRLAALAGYARSAELAGEAAEAARAWREVCDLLAEGREGERAEAFRCLAAVHDMRGDRESALAARRAAAEAFAAAERPADAALEHLGAANYLRGRAEYTPAIDHARAAATAARRAGRPEVEARALGLEGVVTAKRGDHAEGLATVRRGLELAVASDSSSAAAELYQRLSLVIYDAGDYRTAEETLDTALALCETGAGADVTTACVTCMVFVLRECGEWPRAIELGREVIANGPGDWVAEGLLGAIHLHQGKPALARRMLMSCLTAASRVDHFNMAVDSTTALAQLAAYEGAAEEAARRCAEVLARWERSEDHHYAVRGLRWSARFLSAEGDLPGAHRCAEALAAIASRTGHPDALAALAHAVGEIALVQDDAATAAEQIGRALDIHRALDVPADRVEIGMRAGVALAAAGDRETALERLDEAYRGARRLGSRLLAVETAREVAALGESVAGRLGRRAEADAEGSGLSRRELEVVRLVAVGRTNREIARELYLSPRTVDMHVRNILRRLGCRSRVEAAHRAGELGLLV